MSVEPESRLISDTTARILQSMQATEVPRRRKLVYGLIVCVIVFSAAEFLLYCLGVESRAHETDPFVGFSNGFPLFARESTDFAASKFVTCENRLTLFNRQEFPAQKPDKAYRIFCVGGSTVYGRPYDDQTSFSGFLRAVLPEMDPSRRWEVINAGGISYGSARLVLLMHELVRYEPDLFIVYTGHNEFLEDQTYSSLMRTPESIRTLAGWASHLRTFSVMHRIVSGSNSADSKVKATQSQEVNAILDQAIGPAAYHRDEQWRRDVTSQFRTNLERILTLANQAGAKVLLVTPASNVRDCQPFKSEFRADLTGAEQREFAAKVSAAQEDFEAGKKERAIQEINAASIIDSRHATTQYLRGRILLDSGQIDAARDAFVSALKEDICPLRARPEIVDIIRDVAAERDVPLLDFVRSVEKISAHKLPGNDWFLDHVHPTITGHQLLAEQLCDLLTELRIATPKAGWGPNNFRSVADKIEGQIDPQKHAIALRNLAKVLSWAGKVEEADRLAERAAKMLPDDTESQCLAGLSALRSGQVAEAKQHLERSLKINPRNVRALDGMGNVLSRQGEHDTARQFFTAALRIDPSHVPSWFNLGNELSNLGQLSKADDAYRKALALAPNQPDVHKNLGLVLLAQGKTAAGTKHFETALQLDPNAPQRHVDLGFVWIDAKEFLQAEKAFATAMEIDPVYPPALLGIAVLHEQRGNKAEAAKVIKHALTLDPENSVFLSVLARVQEPEPVGQP